MGESIAEQLYRDLGQNEYGQILQDNVRFGRFKPDDIDNETWVHVLGKDVNNLEHMEHTAGITAWYIFESERLGYPMRREDQATLMMTAWTHDFAEAIDGDIPDPHKVHSEEEHAKERRSWLRVMGSVSSTPELMGVAIFPVMFGEVDIARDFRAIEVIGYHDTALKAREQAHAMELDKKAPDQITPEEASLYLALVKLYIEVAPNSVKQLKQFKDLPVVAEYLRNKA